jgi:hypothetical protein
MTMKKILILLFILCAVIAACMPPASANHLSIQMTGPDTVAPGEIFNIGILVTNLAPVYLDHCNFWFSISPWADLILIPWGEFDPSEHLHSFSDTLAYPPPYGTSGYFGPVLAKVRDDAPDGTLIIAEISMDIIADMVGPDDQVCYGCWGDGASASRSTVVVSSPDPSPVPEFPSPFLPAAMIIGLSGAVLLIRRTREK